MKFCKDCQEYDNGYCPIMGFKVSINANFCDEYKLSSEVRRLEVAEWLRNRSKNYSNLIKDSEGEWLENYAFHYDETDEVIDLMLDWGDKCLTEAKNKKS